jgi:hypothetical protein
VDHFSVIHLEFQGIALSDELGLKPLLRQKSREPYAPVR